MTPEEPKRRTHQDQPKRRQTGSNGAGDPKREKRDSQWQRSSSAGGLEAFTQFFRTLPQDSGVAYILIQHLDPSQPSRLTEILGSGVAIPVHGGDGGHPDPAGPSLRYPPGKIMTNLTAH